MKSFFKNVNIIQYARTPIGSFLGSLSGFSASQLASFAIKHALQQIRADRVDRIILGHAIPAGCGQNPGRQAAILSGIPNDVDVFTVNKVCASGLKAVTLAAESIALGLDNIIVAGGMESMSQVPYFLNRFPQATLRLGDTRLIDGLLHDGLTDPYSLESMGKVIRV